MNSRRIRSYGIFAILSVLVAVNGWTQAVHDVTITGTVSLANGETLPGVTVTITSPALVSGERQVMSDF